MRSNRAPLSAAAAFASAALALGSGGCGAGSSARHGPGGASGHSRAPAHLRAHHLQPSTIAENRRRGTTGWRLPGPAADVGGLRHGDVAAYVSAEAVLPGQHERIYVSAPGARKVRVQIFRIGWYGGRGGRELLDGGERRVVHQPACTHRTRTGLTECDWRPTLSFTVPPGFASGVYIAKLTATTGRAAVGWSDALFTVRARHPAPLLAVLPTTTYQAYNAWGGDSLYPGGADPVLVTGTHQGVAVSFDRPYDSVTGAGQFFARDIAMVRFLEREREPVSYTTSASLDVDPSQTEATRALLDFGHSEYWSPRQENAFTNARDAGTNLIFLSSDTLAWRVHFARASAASSEPGAPAHVVIAYKEHAVFSPGLALSSALPPGGGAPLTGSAYVGCITPRIGGGGPPLYRYYPWHPTSLRPRWLFAHTGISLATAIPGIVGYEVDQLIPGSPPGAEVLGEGRVACSLERGEPQVTLGADRKLGQTTLYAARSGAIVFASGTLGWELGLDPVPSASPDAPRAPERQLVRLTLNLLRRALAVGSSAAA